MKTLKPIAIAAAFVVSSQVSPLRCSAQDTPSPQPEAPQAEAAPAPQTEAAPAPKAETAPAIKGQSAQAPTQNQSQGVDRKEQFRQRMNEHLKAALKVSDEEWSVIQPLLEKVQIKMRESMQNRFGMMGGRRRVQVPNASGDNNANLHARPAAPKFPEMEALQKALENESTSPEELKAKLQALREERKKSTAELEQAQEDLRKVLTQRQEATLVMMGLLQ